MDLHDAVWTRLVKAYGKIARLAMSPVLARFVDADLTVTGERSYQVGARRLKTMGRLTASATHAAQVDALIAEVRETRRRRPPLRQEFTAPGYPDAPGLRQGVVTSRC